MPLPVAVAKEVGFLPPGLLGFIVAGFINPHLPGRCQVAPEHAGRPFRDASENSLPLGEAREPFPQGLDQSSGQRLHIMPAAFRVAGRYRAGRRVGIEFEAIDGQALQLVSTEARSSRHTVEHGPHGAGGRMIGQRSPFGHVEQPPYLIGGHLSPNVSPVGLGIE